MMHGPTNIKDNHQINENIFCALFMSILFSFHAVGLVNSLILEVIKDK
jgi:hypothetical protein